MAYLLDDFSREDGCSLFGTEWLVFSDQVMGGHSEIRVQRIQEPTGAFLRIKGEVRPENQKGFIQVALPLVHSRYLFDARHFQGVYLQARAWQKEGWSIHLRTKELSMPWQHYRAPFYPTPEWTTYEIPFTLFYPVSTIHPLNLERLTRLGIVAAGEQAFQPQLELRAIGFYPG